jgi:hypothetical protein
MGARSFLAAAFLRNMFYDENGRHVRTKKEILDENGNVRKGCKIVKKGEVFLPPRISW